MEKENINLFFQGQGFITNDVLKDILREIDNTLTEDDLVHIIEEVDEDGSGTMDFDEFQEMMMGWNPACLAQFILDVLLPWYFVSNNEHTEKEQILLISGTIGKVRQRI